MLELLCEASVENISANSAGHVFDRPRVYPQSRHTVSSLTPAPVRYVHRCTRIDGAGVAHGSAGIPHAFTPAATLISCAVPR